MDSDWVFNNGNIEFKTLYNNERYWRIIVSSDIIIRDINQLDDMTLNAFYQTNYGLLNGKNTISAKTSIHGKNIGRKNQTTNLQQAIKDCISMINKKIKAGYSTDLNTENIDSIFPMALNTYENHKEKIKYPIFIQPKLDGVRMTATILENDRVDILSRRLHKIQGFDTIKHQLKSLIIELKKTYGSKFKFIDGELYKHGIHLQDISGIVRGNVDEDKETLEYYIFDICVEGVLFEERYSKTTDIFNNLESKDKLVLVDTKLCDSEINGDHLFEYFLKEKYEGIVYKPLNEVYEFSTSREKRSLKYLKRKKQHDEEFEICDFSDGNGKFKGMVIFTLKTSEGVEFQCVPMGNSDFRKKIYKECLEDFSKYKGKMAKVKFDDWSKSKIPTRAVIVQIVRDLNFE